MKKTNSSSSVVVAPSFAKIGESQGLSSKQRDPSTHPWRYTGKVKGGLFKDIEPIPFDPRVDVPHGVCFNCWQYGHSRQKCPEPDRLDHCRNCGRIGVKVKNCPRCSQAYSNYWQNEDFQHDNLERLKLELAEIRTAQGWKTKEDVVSFIHFSDVKPIPFDPKIDIPFTMCSNCWDSRHSGLCAKPRVHKHCSNCGRIAVHFATCPRCFQIYPRYRQRKLQGRIDTDLPSIGEAKNKPEEPQTPKISSKLLAKNSLMTSTVFESFSAVVKETDDGYFSQTGSLNNVNTLVEKDDRLPKFTGDYVRDFKKLMNYIKSISITKQDTIVVQFITQRRKIIEKIEYERTKF